MINLDDTVIKLVWEKKIEYKVHFVMLLNDITFDFKYASRNAFSFSCSKSLFLFLR